MSSSVTINNGENTVRQPNRLPSEEPTAKKAKSSATLTANYRDWSSDGKQPAPGPVYVLQFTTHLSQDETRTPTGQPAHVMSSSKGEAFKESITPLSLGNVVAVFLV